MELIDLVEADIEKDLNEEDVGAAGQRVKKRRLKKQQKKKHTTYYQAN